MKKLLGFILSVLVMISCTFAINQPAIDSNITLETGNSFYSSYQCRDGHEYYITSHNYVGDSFFLEDTFRANDGYYYIFDTSSTVEVIDPYNVFNFNGDNNFKWKSNGKPIESIVEEVIFVQKEGSIKTGNILNGGYNGGIAAQIAFRLKRGAFYHPWVGGTRYDIIRLPYGSTQQQTDYWHLKPYSSTMYGGLECFNYIVHYCGDGVRDTQASMATLGKTGSVANEECDPNDPTQSNWGTYGCNINCTRKDIPDTYCGNGVLDAGEECDPGSNNFGNGCNNDCKLMTPECTLTVSPNQGNIPLNTTINATKPNWAIYTNLVFGDGQSQSNPAFALNHTYNSVGTFYLTLTVQNNYNGQINGTKPTATCSASVNTTNSEQQPQCNSQYNGQTQYTPNSNPWLNNTMNLCTIGTLSNFNYSGTPRTFTWNCVTSGGISVPCTANQQRCGDGQLNGSESCDEGSLNGTPGHCNLACTGQVEPGQPILTIEKEQISTGTMEAGTLVAYKITVKNIGSGVATGVTIYDLLPTELQYLNSNISIVPNSTYHFTTGTIFTGGVYRDYILYTDITLDVNGTATVYPVGMVKSGFTFDTLTNCATVSGFNISPNEDCVTTTPPTPHLPHLTINKELLTTGDWIAGNTVAYKITLTNDGNATYYSAYILDILPNAIQYQTSSIQNISDYLFEEGTTGNNEYYIKYYNFDLPAGQSAIVYLTGVLKQGFNYNQTTNCAMAPGTIDCEDSPLRPIPYIQKYQKAGQDMDPNSYGWTTNKLTVGLGEYISYRIDFGNIGNKAATGVVQDILPNCVEYVTGKLVGAIGVGPTYNKKTHIVQVINIPLQPRQIAHLMIIGQIKQVAGCENVYSYLNTGAFHFIGEPWQNSTVLAERDNTITDVEITKEVDTEDTVQPGQVVTYTINYENKGPEILQSYTIVDYWPSELTFSGVVYMNPVASNYPGFRESNNGNKIVRWTFDTPLPVNGTGQIVIQGIVNDY